MSKGKFLVQARPIMGEDGRTHPTRDVATFYDMYEACEYAQWLLTTKSKYYSATRVSRSRKVNETLESYPPPLNNELP